MKHSRLVAASTILALTHSVALPQSGGFAPGELVLYSPAITGSSTGDGGIVRIDPLTGQASLLLDLTTTQFRQGGAAYDPFRDRLIFCGGFTVTSEPLKLYALDAFGNAQDLALGNRSLFAIAPANAGRIYYVDSGTQTTAPFKYIDADNAEHVLLDSAGALPYEFSSNNFVGTMIYDAPTHALIIATPVGAAQTCPGGLTTAISVRKASLSSDGARVLDPVICAQFTVDAGSTCVPVGLSRAPGGQLLMVVDSNSNATQPRMVLLDPATLAMSAFASNGHAFAAATNAGTYSSVRGEAVIFDTGNDVLRAFAQGTSGAGTVITPSMQISPSGTTGEVATLIEIPVGACGTNNVALYCTAKTTSSGCVPAITTSGGPSMSVASGFVISAGQIEPQKSGIFFYGSSGANAAPFQGGVLCVAPPTQRTPVQSSGGAAACSGAFSFDFNAWLAGGNDPLVVAGTQINGQFWFRDPASASTTGLSAGVEFSMCP